MTCRSKLYEWFRRAGLWDLPKWHRPAKDRLSEVAARLDVLVRNVAELNVKLTKLEKDQAEFRKKHGL